MAHYMICVRHRDTIFNYGVYSREFAPVEFDDSAAGVALRHDPCTNAGQYFLIRSITLLVPKGRRQSYIVEKNDVEKSNEFYAECESEQLDSENIYQEVRQRRSQQSPKNEVMKVQKLSFVHLDVESKLSLDFPSNLAFCSFQQVLNSRQFRKQFVQYFHCKRRWKDCRYDVCRCEQVHKVCDFSINVPKLIEVSVLDTPVPVCYAWFYRLEGLARKKVILEDTMAWLSTLGGGYSSLGDYFSNCSEIAGKISVKQLQIAKEMSDPIMASKCRLFYALSLMQSGNLKDSKTMIRREHTFATGGKWHDQKLIDMCKGIWSKLQYLYMQRAGVKQRAIQATESAEHDDRADARTSAKQQAIQVAESVDENHQHGVQQPITKMPSSPSSNDHNINGYLVNSS